MTLIPMNVEQLRRQAIKNAQLREQQEKNYQVKVEQLSKHNVGNYLDIRTIKKSKQLKDQKNYYSIEMAIQELEDLLQNNRLYKFSSLTQSFIKKITGRENDSYTIRETGKFLSELINELKLKYEVKD